MTPKEKARQLLNLFKDEQPIYDNIDDDITETEKHEIYFGKRCAIIVCDQMNLEYIELARIIEKRFYDEAIIYWNNTRKEIKKLK